MLTLNLIMSLVVKIKTISIFSVCHNYPITGCDVHRPRGSKDVQSTAGMFENSIFVVYVRLESHCFDRSLVISPLSTYSVHVDQWLVPLQFYIARYKLRKSLKNPA